MRPIKNPEVKDRYENYGEKYKTVLLEIREKIFEVSEKMYGADSITEELKWNQPSYSVKNGSPIRLDIFDKNNIGIFFNCRTTLVENFKVLFGDLFLYSKNRAIILDVEEEIPVNELVVCIEMALSYHKIKKRLNKLN
jgi:hypothetical protein